jgi:hypothetical protein
MDMKGSGFGVQGSEFENGHEKAQKGTKPIVQWAGRNINLH